ncbi:MAG: response regulator, partial [Clostridia bacterium]
MKKQPTMMIIDDLDINLKLLYEIFKDDYKIILATNGVEAWDKLSTEDFDIILADLIMPEMDGFDFLKKIKNNVAFFDIPVVVTTAYDDDSYQIKALELGAADFISKPYNPIIVKKRIANIVATANVNFYRASMQFDGMTGLYNRESFCNKVA